ncbi:hypothetical protein F4801DRAFT_535399 [Xylaria longipes]|nr:hypothetical protein F4801DRAFT_535399 [Xylaria longipes]
MFVSKYNVLKIVSWLSGGGEGGYVQHDSTQGISILSRGRRGSKKWGTTPDRSVYGTGRRPLAFETHFPKLDTLELRLVHRLLPRSSAQHPLPSSEATIVQLTRTPLSNHEFYSHQDMSRAGKLAPEQLPVLFIKNLNYEVTDGDLFKLFDPDETGIIRQIRKGISGETKGTAYVVFWNAMDAKNALEKLNGFNFQNRYLVVLWHQPEKTLKMKESKDDVHTRQESLGQLKKQYGID